MTIDGPTSIVLTVVGLAIAFAAVVGSTGVRAFDREGRRRTAACGAMLLVGMTIVWAASSAGFAA